MTSFCKHKIIIALLLFVFSCPIAIHADECNCMIEGKVVDAETGKSLGWSSVVLVELKHGVTAHADGTFHLINIPSGTYTMNVSRLGYRDAIYSVSIGQGDTLSYNVVLSHSTLEFDEVELMGDTGNQQKSAIAKMSGGELRRELGLTIAETVESEAGFAQRSMGPAPARPVIRGLSGNRLSIIEDGAETGDLSGSSADHAVAIDPITASGIEIFRGPETVFFGPVSIGGVVNVNRGAIHYHHPHRFSADAVYSFESVNKGSATGLNAILPMGKYTIQVDGNIRETDDISTPDGTLKNTSLTTRNYSLGMNRFSRFWNVGVSATAYETEYGIPGGFIGAHPNGVNIDMERKNLHLSLNRLIDNNWLNRIENKYSFATYNHSEYESNGSLGMRFEVFKQDMTSTAYLNGPGFWDKSAIGINLSYREYTTGGLTFTPSTDMAGAALFFFNEKQVKSLKYKYAVRLDNKAVIPEEEKTSYFIGKIESKNFWGWSGSFSLEYLTQSAYKPTITFTKSWRSPEIEELFSEGPHLAAYSYEVGNPEISAENGYGLDLGLIFDIPHLTQKVSIFTNYFDSYIAPRNTGELNPRRADLYEYRYSGIEAMISGAEYYMDWQFAHNFNCFAKLSYVNGQYLSGDANMPMIPPFDVNFGVQFSDAMTTAGLEIKGAYEQSNTDEFEESTAAWIRFDSFIQHQFVWQGFLNTITLSAENITNTAYRNHLSRVKVIMPEAGRNFKLVYKIYI